MGWSQHRAKDVWVFDILDLPGKVVLWCSIQGHSYVESQARIIGVRCFGEKKVHSMRGGGTKKHIP